MNDLPNDGSGATCYACDQPGPTREHAPPKSFFPEGKRLDLITVPSCSAHNNDNSADVEYVRNAIVSIAGLNEAGGILMDKAKRSFDRSTALFDRTFQSLVVHSREEQLGTYKFDLNRVDKVMSAVVQALHYRDHGQKWTRWLVFVPSLGSESSLVHQTPDGSDSLRGLFDGLSYVKRPTAVPEVFTYGSCALNWGWAYRLTFYGGFVVNALMGPHNAEIKSAQRQKAGQTREHP